MESKNVKVVDEHGIDRTANIICSIDVDGTDYVVYWIERDSDNDNLFVSKLIKNNDGTSNMMNIEDSMEKGKLTDIVKELITYSVNNEASNLEENKVTLAGGKVVGISSVLFNKEQNINVSKTYITTVKKSVTKVSEEFYVVKEKVPEAASEVQPFFEAVVNEGIVEKPEEPPVAPAVPTPVVEPVIEVPEMPVLEMPTLDVPEPVKEVETPVASGPTMAVGEEFLPKEEPVVEVPAVPETPEVVAPEVMAPVEPEPVVPSAPVVEAPKVEVIPPVGPGLPGYVAPKPEPVPETPVVPTEPEVVAPTQPEVVVPTPAPEVNPTVVEAPKLVFDASKETNLTGALEDAASEKPIAVDNVETIREFGQDEPVQAPAESAASETPVSPAAGFANNKFFMVIAIAFFLASCVFLGYEVFNYFQIKG